MVITILGTDQVNSGKNTEINKQLHVKFWFNKKYGADSYLFSCINSFADKCTSLEIQEAKTSC